MRVWVDAFQGCHEVTESGINRVEWPCGGSYVDQENLVVSMFLLLHGVIVEVLAQASKNGRSNQVRN